MIGLLSNTSWQFAITSALAIISILVNVWFASKRQVQFPIAYETTAWEPVDNSDEEVKEILKKRKAQPDNTMATRGLSFVTFKIWNYGSESITLPQKTKPLTIMFEKGTEILDYKIIARMPDYVKFTVKLDAEKLLLTIPLLDPNESITLRVLITDFVDYLPVIDVRVPGKKRIVRANNIRLSKEWRILAVLYLLAVVGFYWYFVKYLSQYEQSSEFPFKLFLGTFAICGISALLLSFSLRKMRPYTSMPLPSTLIRMYLQMFIRGLPFLLILGVLGTAIYLWLGLRALALFFLIILMGLWIPLTIWIAFYTGVKKFLQKRKKAYNVVVITLLTGIPSMVMWAFWICVFIFVYKVP